MDLQKLRIQQGMTAEQVAQKAEITRSAYSNIELGYRSPSVAVAKRIAAVLGFDWTMFYAEE